VLLFADKAEEVKAGTRYLLRLRKFTLAPGAASTESTSSTHSIGYVLEGTHTHRIGTTDRKDEAGKLFDEQPNVPHVHKNDGTGTLRFLKVDLRPEPAP
jgi:quercetin dioxygenase-like cupin family protein